ncbi:MAG: transposase, partial [Rhodothermales bacterium]
DRIISAEDTVTLRGRKSTSTLFDGYKVHVAEDLETELITDIDVTPGNAHDSEPVEKMLSGSAERLGAAPKELIGDTHYGSTDLRADLAEHGIEVIAKLPGVGNQGRFTKADFDIDLETETVTCPAGYTTQKYYLRRDDKGRRVRCYQFSAATCSDCPLRVRCTRSKRGRSISLNYHERTLQEAHAYNQTAEFKRKYRRRALVERKLSELLWRHRLRYGRFIGTRKTRLQALWKAAVVNLKRLGKLLDAAFESPEEAMLHVAA